MGRHSVARPPLWIRVQAVPGLMARRSPLGLTVGVTVVALTASAASAAFVMTPSPAETARADAAPQAVEPAAPVEESVVEIVDTATAEIARADYVADTAQLTPDHASEISDARAELDSLVDEAEDIAAAADADPAAEKSESTTSASTSDRGTTETASRSTERTAAPESAEAVSKDESADTTADDESATDEPTAQSTPDVTEEDIPADVTDDTEATTEEISAKTAYLAELLDAVEHTVPVGVEAAPPSAEEIAAEEAAKAAEEAEELAAMAGSTASYSNGNIPSSALCAPDFSSTTLLRCDAAHELEGLNRAYEAQFGHSIVISDSYRSYSAQVSTKAAKGYLAATPGTSNHGWGTAIDMGDTVGGYGTAEYNWMLENAPAFGWDNPAWARAGGSKSEPWHWEYGTSS